ncbi:MAG: cell division protein FtsB [Bacteroidetes bacterium 43-16]|nr:MAG: cell division protein FtsB [Bacteroidetes bacterium 43-16]
MPAFFINNRWFLVLATIAVACVLAFFIPWIWNIAMILLLLLAILTVVDALLLFSKQQKITADRFTTERWHLGEDNMVSLRIGTAYSFPVHLEIIDELPDVFQKRDFILHYKTTPGKALSKQYILKPLKRGAYSFGDINVYVMSPLQLLKARYKFDAPLTVKVYPTTKLLRSYQLLATTDRHSLFGARKVRRLGHSIEFEQIKEYVIGDDIRTINWKATARRGSMMVNTYTDIRSQQIFCIIDKGRSMKMPFEGMTLMDHSIKSALVFLNIALHKHDKAGLITFSSQVNDIIPADQGAKQMHKILETLYNQTTDFQDADYERLLGQVHLKISQRSFLLLFSNFESLSSLNRQMPYLRGIAKKHMLCVVFFENTAVKEIVDNQPDTIEGIYTKTIAERFDYEKKQMVKELRRYGIIAILTTPEKLTVDVINNYLELKSRQLL